MWFPGHWPQNYMGSLFKMQIPPSYSVGGNANWCSHCGKQYGVLSKKLKIVAPYDPAIPLLGMLLFSRSVMSNSLRPHGLQHATLPCPSPSPRAWSNSCPLSQCCHPTISSSVVPFSSCPQSLPASGSFQMSQLFVSGGQSIGASASVSVLPMNIQGWFPLGLTGLI